MLKHPYIKANDIAASYLVVSMANCHVSLVTIVVLRIAHARTGHILYSIAIYINNAFKQTTNTN